MRVLILASDVSSRSGIERYTAALATAFGEVLGPGNVDVLVWLKRGDAVEAVSGFRVFGPLSNNTRLPSKLRFIGKSLRMGRKRYDLVIANHVALGPVAGMIRLFWGTPFWVPCYGFEVWYPLPTMELAALKRAELVFPVSKFTAEKLEKVNCIPPAKMRILHFAISRRLSSLLLASNGGVDAVAPGGRERVLLSVGRLNKASAYKGYDTVIRALPKILAQVPEARYVIVGNGDNRPNLEKLAADMGVAHRVSFAGEVPDTELGVLYRTCDLFVLPSRAQGVDGPDSGEGFGGVYVEASLAGKPVVGSREAGAAEAVVDGVTGFLVNPQSVDEVADAALRLLSDTGLAARMGEAGRKWAGENFTQEAMSRTLEELLRLTGHATKS